jgi:hypothetical protein
MNRMIFRRAVLPGVVGLCASPALAEDWWALPFGANREAVTALYAERSGIVDSVLGKSVWIVETFDPQRTDVAVKKEHVDIDCRRPRYRGLEWYWTDHAGEVTTSSEEDARWNTVLLDSPMQAVRDFACAGPGEGAQQVTGVPGG